METEDISIPKCLLFRLNHTNENSQPHPDYKDTLDSSVSKIRDDQLGLLFETYGNNQIQSPNRPTSRTVAVEARPEQASFRKTAVNYGSTCCISGYGVEAALHAAHIVDYAFSKDNSPQNGLCLRADIHILFDKGLLRVSSDYVIEVDEELLGTQYWEYNGSQISPHNSS